MSVKDIAADLRGEPTTWQKHAQEWSVEQLQAPIDYAQSLLGNRYLERGGTMAVVAPSGIGKTVWSIQVAANFSVAKFYAIRVDMFQCNAHNK